jgi:hypothetical protein
VRRTAFETVSRGFAQRYHLVPGSQGGAVPSLGDPFRDATLEMSVDALGQLRGDGRFSRFGTTAGTSASVVGARLSAADGRTLATATAASSPTAHANLLVKLRLPVAAATG